MRIPIVLILLCGFRLGDCAVGIALWNCIVGITLWELHYKDCIVGIALSGFCYNCADFAVTMQISLCGCIPSAVLTKSCAD